MSTQLESYKDSEDQDPTDELPVLDVAAYEAAFLEHGDDTVQLNIAELNKSVATLASPAPEAQLSLPVKVRGRDPKGQAKLELTADVDLILKRITDLEAQVVNLRGVNDGLKLRCDTLIAEREAQARGLLAIQADNARLVEHRSLAAEMTARLEEKLREQAAQSVVQITALQTQRNEENTKYEQVRTELQQHLAETRLQLAALQQDHNLLREDLRTTSGLAAGRAETIANLQSHLSQAESSAAQLARQLAARLMDADSLTKQLEARNLTIAELRESVESLGAKLSEALTSIHEMTDQLARRDQQLADDRAQLARRAVEIADRDGRIAQLCKDIKHATDELHLVSAQRDDLLKTLASYEQAQAASHKVQTEQVQQIGELKLALQTSQANAASLQVQLQTVQGELDKEKKMHSRAAASLESSQHQLDKVRYELDVARVSIQALTDERNALLPLREKLATASAELERSGKAFELSQQDLANLRSEFTAQAERTQALQADLTAARSNADELTEERAQLQQALLAAQHAVESHKEREQTQEMMLSEKNREAESLRVELDEQAVTLGEMNEDIRTRDELVEELRAKLQTKNYDEAAVAERIAQAQQRVQSLVQLIAHKNRKIASLKSDVTVYAAALAAIRGNLTRVTGDDLDGTPLQRIMEPVEHDGQPIALDRKVTTIGRTIENDICLPSKLISRHHARVLVAPNGVIVEDTGSTNGCFVNGRQIRQQLMRDGDILSLGGLRYRLCAQPIDEQPVNDIRSRGNVIDIKDVRPSLVDAE
jgi:pSer/pThr/pTyr-binding forkhead associated (FHA) protein